jgi:hypothetical protein
MSIRSTTTLVVLAVAMLIAAIQGASANRLSVDELLIRVVWPEESKLAFGNSARMAEISCAVTLEGSFHNRVITKTNGSLIGYITRVATGPIANCTKNNVTAIRYLPEGLPWHVLYDSFSGTLPAITNVRLQFVGLQVLITAFGSSCLYRSLGEAPAFFNMRREAGSTVTSLVAEGTQPIRLLSGGIICPELAGFAGTATQVTRLGTTGAIHVTLI